MATAGPGGPNTMWYLALVMLTVGMAVGSVWMMRVWNDVKGETEETTNDPDDLLGPLAEAYAAGQMSEEEYRRIKQSLGRGGAPAAPVAPRTTSTTSPPDSPAGG